MKRIQYKASCLAVFAILVLFSGQMMAQCGSLDQLKPKLKPQAWRQGARPNSLLTVSDSSGGIVGMWNFKFISQGNGDFIPDGVVLDHGFAQWHEDGTEITNSSRLPSTGSFCLGTWQKVGPSHYKLNHFAMGFDDGVHESYSNIREDVVVKEDGNSFSGTFVIAIYDLQGNPGPVIKGVITAVRVKINSTVQDIL